MLEGPPRGTTFRVPASRIGKAFTGMGCHRVDHFGQRRRRRIVVEENAVHKR
jgi:hypothetical protein